MPDRIAQIEDVAIAARLAFEHHTIPRTELRPLVAPYLAAAGLGHGFDAVEDYLDIMTILFPVENCDLATAYLQQKLGEGELTIGTYNHYPHVFLSVFIGLGKVAVDITADQFGGPPVYVGPIEDPWARNEALYRSLRADS